MRKLILNIKNKKNRFYKFIYNFVMFFLHFSIPINSFTAIPFRVIYVVHIGIIELLKLGLKIFYFEPMFRSKCKKVGKRLRMGKMPYIQGHGDIILGNNVYLSHQPTFITASPVYEKPKITIGNNTFIGSQTTLFASQKIQIGNNCLIAAGVRIYDSDGHPIDHKKRRNLEKVSKSQIKPVIIGDDVWIGTRSIVLKGVTIGARSIVAAGAVVVKDVPPDSVVAGNPARIVKYLSNDDK